MNKRHFLILPGVLSILLMGMVLTFITFQYFRWEIKKSIDHQLQEKGSIYTGMITSKANQYITLMLSLRNFFKFSETVTRDEFSGFTSMILAKEPGLKALCWVPRVKEAQRFQYEMTARKEGFLGFSFQSDSDSTIQSDRSYLPVYYVEPLGKNSVFFGQDLKASVSISEALEKAVQTGEPTVIMKPSLETIPAACMPSDNCWIVVPVFNKHGLYCTTEGRRKCLTGYIVGIIDVSVMLDSILKDTKDQTFPVQLHISDVTDNLYTLLCAETTCLCSDFVIERQDGVAENKFSFADRIWKIYCVDNKHSHFSQDKAWMVWLILPVGLILTGLVELYLYTLYYRNELADSLVEKRTRELKEHKEKADAITIEAERSNRAKSVFLASMSHDIRTPMNAILGFCELLSEESLSGDQKFYVDTIHSNSKNLLVLLNDVLDLSKIEAGRMHIDLRDFDLKELLDSVKSMFLMSAQNHNLDFRFIMQSPVPQIIHSDPVRIRQCLVNLIANAMKFTRKGYVHVHVTCENSRLKLAVEDTGIGISETGLKSIFNAFNAVQETHCQEGESGSGLGLTITLQLARLMGGDVAVQSQPGQGSVFTLDIPVDVKEDNVQTIFQTAARDEGRDET